MSLRKSPKRTRALLAANRRNSRKSTGPRTRAGRWHSSWNAVRHGRRARASCRLIPVATHDLKAFMDFYFKLHDAIIPADSLAGDQAVLNKVLEAWKVKRVLDRWIDRQTKEDWLVLAAGAVPPPSFWRLKLRRPGLSSPGWTVTISVWLRWGRGPGWSRPSSSEGDTKPDRPRMHTMVSVHSTGPATRPGRRAESLGTERTKPECYTVQTSSGNMSLPAHWDPAYLEAYALAERIVGWLMPWGKRTKPECNRKQAACKNISAAGSAEGRVQNGQGLLTQFGTKLRETLDRLRMPPASRQMCLDFTANRAKPECNRKQGASKSISKSLGWLGAAASFLLETRPNEPAI